MQPQPQFNVSDPQNNVACSQCGAPMPKGMRFCRSCGNRLGEGTAEYTETVRFPNAQTAPASRGTTPFYSPLEPVSSAGYCRSRRRVRGMTWLWIAIALFFAFGGGLSMFKKKNIRINGRQIAAVASSRSYVGVDGFRDAANDGGATFDAVSPPDGPADKAGLVGGDIVTSFDGHQVKDEGQMMDLLSQTPIGKTVEVIYTRDANSHKTQMTTISGDEMDRLKQAYNSRPERKGKFGFEIFRTTVVNDPANKAFGVKLNWVEPNGPADLFGIKEGDIITDFDKVPIRTKDELLSRVYRALPKSVVEVGILRDGQPMRIPVTMGRN